MTSALLQELLMEVAVLCMFLLLGMFLRARVPAFRKMLLPASVIGGFIALLVGPRVWGEHSLLPISEATVNSWSLLPGVLIVPIFAAVPLGKGMNEQNSKSSARKNLPSVLASGGQFGLTSSLQSVLGFGIALLCMKFFPSLNLYRTFGVELSSGFAGGHGTAAGLGAILQGYGLDYWELSQGVATTFATIGLMGGMILGIAMINRASARGETRILKKAGEIPMSTLKGYTTDIREQKSLGRETTSSSSIETITVHLGIILADSALAYYLRSLAVAYGIPGLSSIPVWFYALLQMYAINWLLKKLHLDWMIDVHLKSRITGALSDIAICAAIASMPIKAVASYAGLIAIMSIAGFVVTYLVVFPLCRWIFGSSYPFERAIISWGVSTGVMINGMMLLKICDPDYDSPALNDFSMGFAMLSIISIFTSPFYYGFLQSGTTMQNFLWALFTFTLYTVIMLVGRAGLKKEAPENYAKAQPVQPVISGEVGE